MQAISIAIGKSGIQLFAEHIVAAHIIELLKTLPAPDRSIPVAGTWKIPCGKFETEWDVKDSTFSISLGNGSVQNLVAKCTAVVQDPKDNTIFQCTFEAGAFSVKYSWTENYQRDEYAYLQGMGWVWSNTKQITNRYDYSPSFSGLTLTVRFQFKYDASAGWEMVIQGKPGISTTETNANVPKDSAVQYSSQQCQFGHSVSDAALQALSDIDFNGKVGDVIKGVIASIPSSGDLGGGIQYDFSSGDDGLKFPVPNSIQMGVKGGASYKGTVFTENNPPVLPLPTAPGDSDLHDLNMYVSNYEVDALNWAFFKAGDLNTIVNAADLKDADILKVKTYVNQCPELKPYSTRAIQAVIAPNAAPLTAFQLVYGFTDEAMKKLAAKLTVPEMQDISGLQGNYYVSKADLESDLGNSGINPSRFKDIELIIEFMGMAVTHDINYTLVIQDFQPTQPTIVFNVKRTDILTDLALGLGGADKTNQTLLFQFVNVVWTENFISSSIPKLTPSVFANIWQNAGEFQYVTLMNKLGAVGVPLPIMKGFKFDFTNAVLNLEEGYISILANVQYV